MLGNNKNPKPNPETTSSLGYLRPLVIVGPSGVGKGTLTLGLELNGSRMCSSSCYRFGLLSLGFGIQGLGFLLYQIS